MCQHPARTSGEDACPVRLVRNGVSEYKITLVMGWGGGDVTMGYTTESSRKQSLWKTKFLYYKFIYQFIYQFMIPCPRQCECTQNLYQNASKIKSQICRLCHPLPQEYQICEITMNVHRMITKNTLHPGMLTFQRNHEFVTIRTEKRGIRTGQNISK